MLEPKGTRGVWSVSLTIGALMIILFLPSTVWASSSQQESAPPASVTTTLTPGVAGTLVSTDGRVTVSIPAEAAAAAGTLSYEEGTQADAPGAPPAGKAFASILFDLTVLDTNGSPVSDYRFSASITISVKYTDADVQAADGNPARLELQKYDTALKAWSPLSTTFDPVTRTVRGQVNRLTFFALMGQAKASTPTPTPTPTLEPWVPTATPTVTPTPLPTPTPTAVPPTATATPVPPTTGDVAPGSGLLVGLLMAAAILIAAGGYYLRQAKSA